MSLDKAATSICLPGRNDRSLSIRLHIGKSEINGYLAITDPKRGLLLDIELESADEIKLAGETLLQIHQAIMSGRVGKGKID